jgi:glycosyltransferase involved in cell wall biosynthesis
MDNATMDRQRNDEFSISSQSIKDGMKKTTRYKNEIIISDYMDENVLWATLKQCHSFVMPSRGEAWCYPAMEAMAFGIPVIYTDGIGVGDYVTDGQTGFAVQSHPTPCYKANDTFQDIYTSKDAWLEPSVYHLQNAMRRMYASYAEGTYETYSKNCIEAVKKYDYRNSKLVEGLL